MGDPFKLKAQVLCGDAVAMGPGKAALLDALRREGSISAAGRALGMSYRRTWLLIDEMNRCWAEPVVATTRAGGGGAQVTAMGLAVLAEYREIERAVQHAALTTPSSKRLAAMLRPAPLPGKRA